MRYAPVTKYATFNTDKIIYLDYVQLYIKYLLDTFV